MKTIYLTLSLVFCANFIFGQNLTIEIERDTFNIEDNFSVKYTVNKSCSLNALNFENFIIVAGPSTSKSISIINGERKAETSATYLLTPIEEGTFDLPSELCGVKLEKPVKVTAIKGYESREDVDKRIRKARKIKKI